MGYLRTLFASCLALALSGCAGYRVGPSNGGRAGEKSVQVVPFTNQTSEPRLGDDATAALRKEIQRDATFRLASNEPGDIVVSGVIILFLRSGVSFLPTDVITARDYRLIMTAHVTARDRVTGKILLEKTMSGDTTVRVGSDLPSAERQARPLLATDLAQQITSLLADGTW
jgi:Lipopolysaccharide-assembly